MLEADVGIFDWFTAVPEDVYRARLAVCGRCPYLFRHPAGGTCKICGCFVAVKAKLKNQTCSKGYWPR